MIVGLTRYVNKGHIARAALEATAWQTREVLDAMNKDSGVTLTALKVDGGMVYNDLLMQFQADVLGVPVIRPKVAETTALGAAYAAGLAVGFWAEVEDLRANWGKDKEWHPKMDAGERDREYAHGRRPSRARSIGWRADRHLRDVPTAGAWAARLGSRAASLCQEEHHVGRHRRASRIPHRSPKTSWSLVTALANLSPDELRLRARRGP